ncbi:MAG: hypothetical protein MKZ99_00450 [Candidatus Marinimicrobia bacterium]|jgi:hypothetical protein|nr:hypothetical protein [Candidatus Neomarinimicrobiota bacterium]
MKNKLYIFLVVSLSLVSLLVAQDDPPELPGAPNQGPISGLIWLALSGGILAAKKYFDRNK